MYAGFFERGLLAISQQKNAEELAPPQGLEWGKSVPLPVSVELKGFDEYGMYEDISHRELVGILMFLATETRPIIVKAVRVGRYCSSPKTVLLQRR